jgi:thiol-disulfide isomerase/thioredoxin
VKVGEPAPGFSLPATDGTSHGPEGGPVAVVFTCNHCPYALAWHERLLEVARDYEGRARVLMINPNDAERYPRDSLDAMRQRVEADGGWPAPYLRDETQEVARAYHARTTPDVFLLDGEGVLAYRGAPDVDHQDPSAGARWLRDALDAVLEGGTPDPAETEPVGCSVKWSQ